MRQGEEGRKEGGRNVIKKRGGRGKWKWNGERVGSERRRRRRGKIFFILAVQTSHVVSSLRN